MKKIEKSIWQHITEDTEYCCYAKITLSNGKVLTLTSEDDFVVDSNSYTHSAGEGFPIGQALCKTVTLTIENSDNRYSEYDFSGAVINLFTEIEYIDHYEDVIDEDTGETEQEPVYEYDRIKEGIFYVTESVDTRGDVISFTAYDAMIKTDTPFALQTTYPNIDIRIDINSSDANTSVYAAIVRISKHCGIQVSSVLFAKMGTGGEFETLSGIKLGYAPTEQTTCRQMIAILAGMFGGNAYITKDGELDIRAWHLPEMPSTIQGGDFSQTVNDAIYVNFNIATSDVINAGGFGTTITESQIEYYYPSPKALSLSNATDDLTTATDDVMMTAMKIKYHYTFRGAKKEDTITVGLSDVIDSGTSYKSDDYTYIATIEGNGNSIDIPLAQQNIVFENMSTITGVDAERYKRIKNISGTNHIHILAFNNADIIGLFGNSPIKVTISAIYNNHEVYKSVYSYNNISALDASNCQIMDYTGNNLLIQDVNTQDTSYPTISNTIAIASMFLGLSIDYDYVLAFQPSYLDYEKHYVIEIEDLEYVYSQAPNGGPGGVIKGIADNLLGVPFRAYNGNFLPDMSVEFMDNVFVVDRTDTVYNSFITDLTFEFLGKSEFKNGTQSPSDNNSSYGSNSNNAVWEQVNIVSAVANGNTEVTNNYLSVAMDDIIRAILGNGNVTKTTPSETETIFSSGNDAIKIDSTANNGVTISHNYTASTPTWTPLTDYRIVIVDRTKTLLDGQQVILPTQVNANNEITSYITKTVRNGVICNN